jgi:hypothetical protein
MKFQPFNNNFFIYYNFIIRKVLKDIYKRNYILKPYTKVDLNLNKYSTELFKYNFVIITYYGFSKLLKLEKFNIFYDLYKLKFVIKKILHIYKIWRIRNPHDDEIIEEEFVDFYERQYIKYENKFIYCDIWLNYQVELYFFKPYVFKIDLLKNYNNSILINLMINDLIKEFLLLTFNNSLNNINWYINYNINNFVECYIYSSRLLMLNISYILLNYFIQSFCFLRKYLKIFKIFSIILLIKNFNILFVNTNILYFTGKIVAQNYKFYCILLRLPGKGFWCYRNVKHKHLRLV